MGPLVHKEPDGVFVDDDLAGGGGVCVSGTPAPPASGCRSLSCTPAPGTPKLCLWGPPCPP